MIKSVPGFQSVNNLGMLRDGLYDVSEIEFFSSDTGAQATVVEITHADTAELCACDLIIVLSNQAVLFRDFCKIGHKTWRDSNGLVDDSLELLLPPELLAFQQRDGESKSRFILSNDTIAWI